MKKYFFTLLITLFILQFRNAASQTLPVLSTHNYGTLESVSTIQSDFRFVNHGSKTVFILLVNVPENFTYIKPQGIAPGDTGILRITYEPKNTGSFNETIKVFLSDNTKPFELQMLGNIRHIDNAMLHCARFDEPNSYQPTAPLITYTSKDENKNPPPPTDDLIVVQQPTKSDSIILNQPLKPETPNLKQSDSVSTPEFPVSEYAANNIVFVIDVSSSMAEDDKIELLKSSMQLLTQQMRSIDKVAIVSFSTGAELILPCCNGSNHDVMDSVVQSLQARGTTNISAGFDLGVETLLAHYIAEGNNQIFIITDGGFQMPDKSLEKLNNDSRKKNFTIVGIGKDRESQKVLQKLSSRLKAGYVKIKNNSQQHALLEEVKEKSKVK